MLDVWLESPLQLLWLQARESSVCFRYRLTQELRNTPDRWTVLNNCTEKVESRVYIRELVPLYLEVRYIYTKKGNKTESSNLVRPHYVTAIDNSSELSDRIFLRRRRSILKLVHIKKL